MYPPRLSTAEVLFIVACIVIPLILGLLIGGAE